MESSKKEEAPEEPKNEPAEPVEIEKKEEPAVGRITVNKWEKRSSLTMEEIEMRIDEISMGRNPSDGLRALYEAKYGEELEPPAELVQFTMPETSGSEDSEVPDTPEEAEPAESQAIVETERKKGFFKSVFKKKG